MFILGWDFIVLWSAGNALLHGSSPYLLVPDFKYPVQFAYFMAIAAIIPVHIAYLLFLMLSIGLMIIILRRRFWQWLFYVPVLHMFMYGNPELIWWAMAAGLGRHWRGAILGALITLKPQSAFVLLPWHLLDWLRHDRVTLVRWAILTAVIWLAPLLWYPGWVHEWQTNTNYIYGSLFVSPGVFMLLNFIPTLLPMIGVLAVLIFLWGQFFQPYHSKAISRATALLAVPAGLFHSHMALMDMGPAWLLVPLSLLAAILTVITSSFIGFLMLPIAVIAWNVRKSGRRISQRVTLNEQSI